MDYIIFNSDGSIAKQSLNRYIQQGNTGVDKFFIAYDTGVNTDVAQAVFTLPNRTNVTELGVWDELEIDGETYNGWIFTLTTVETTYDGLLMEAVRILRDDNILVNYPFALVVNKTGVMPDTDTGVTIEELDSYLLVLQNIAHTGLELCGDVTGKTIGEIYNLKKNKSASQLISYQQYGPAIFTISPAGGSNYTVRCFDLGINDYRYLTVLGSQNLRYFYDNCAEERIIRSQKLSNSSIVMQLSQPKIFTLAEPLTGFEYDTFIGHSLLDDQNVYGYYLVEIESLTTKARWAGRVLYDATLSQFMVDANRKDYLTEIPAKPSKEFVYINDSLASTKTGIYFKNPTYLMTTDKKPKRSKGQYINNGYGSKICNKPYSIQVDNEDYLFEGHYTFAQFIKLLVASETEHTFEMVQITDSDFLKRLFPVVFRFENPTIANGSFIRTSVFIPKISENLDGVGTLILDSAETRRMRKATTLLPQTSRQKLLNAKVMIKFVENLETKNGNNAHWWTGNMCKNWLELQMAVIHNTSEDTENEYAVDVYYYPIARRFGAYQFTGIGTIPGKDYNQ